MDNLDQLNHLMNIIGERWNLCIINVLDDGPKRFSAIEKTLSINSVTLTNRLKKLEELGFIKRIEHVEDKQSVSYTLTAKGKDLHPLLREMKVCLEKISR